ncbi:MAG: zinc ABC transporter substrate-binding protein [Alistipes sp.]|nr:zinc ABC transporter substrate-binding protein [Alistipes sp.]
MYLRSVKRYLIYIAALLLAVGCTTPPPQPTEPTIYVSIAPLRSLVEAITEQDFPVEVLVPAGASPENFELTPKQYIALNEAQWIFSTGLITFETTLLHKLPEGARIIDLSRGIELIAGTCSHHHHGHAHAHGVDPHTWTSPRALQLMSRTIYEAIHNEHPDSVRYTQNFNRLQERLEALDRAIEAQITASGVEQFIVYHPALTYYARDYGLRQISIEEEGKEPSAKRLAELIRTARAEGIRTVLVQHQFPRSSVDAVADDMEAEVVEFDPLAENVIENIAHITDLITRK